MKSRLYDVAEGGMAIVPRDSDQFDYLRAHALSYGAKVTSFGEHAEADFRLVDYAYDTQVVRAVLRGRNFAYKLGIPGLHMAVNSVGVLAVVDALGLDLNNAAGALGKMEPIAGRGNVMHIPLTSGTAQVFDEAYNANPTSVAAVLAAFGQQRCEIGGRKLALLGDMRELGPRSAELHAGLAQPVLAANLDALMTVGEQMTHLRRVLPERILGPHYATADDVLPDLVGILRAGDQLLVKASHGARLYEVVARMRLGDGGGVAA
jgi:UDP-N-acetylmuramoyl-tripeptide--D-alanyl-D-alanine ligase